MEKARLSDVHATTTPFDGHGPLQPLILVNYEPSSQIRGARARASAALTAQASRVRQGQLSRVHPPRGTTLSVSLNPDGPAGLVATLTRLVVETVRPGVDELTVGWGVGVIRAGRWFEDIRAWFDDDGYGDDPVTTRAFCFSFTVQLSNLFSFLFSFFNSRKVQFH